MARKRKQKKSIYFGNRPGESVTILFSRETDFKSAGGRTVAIKMGETVLAEETKFHVEWTQHIQRLSLPSTYFAHFGSRFEFWTRCVGGNEIYAGYIFLHKYFLLCTKHYYWYASNFHWQYFHFFALW